MKCISKRKKSGTAWSICHRTYQSLHLKEVVLENAYDVCDTSAKYGITENEASVSGNCLRGFSRNRG